MQIMAACRGSGYLLLVLTVGTVLGTANADGDEAAPPVTKDAAPLNTVRVAGIVLKWLRADRPEVREKNYRRIEPMIRQAAAAGAKIVCTTECFLDGYAIADKSIPLEIYHELGERIPDGKYYRKLSGLADELDIYLISGLHEAVGDIQYNTAVLIGPDGILTGKYHKQLLGHEAVRNTAGKTPSVFQTDYGRMGLMICADRTGKDLVKRMCDNGADFLICPSGGSFGKKRNDPILQARSKENNIHIIFVHPAEFLVTGPDGSVLERTILGDPKRRMAALLISPEQASGKMDRNRIFYFDLPIHNRKATAK